MLFCCHGDSSAFLGMLLIISSRSIFLTSVNTAAFVSFVEPWFLHKSALETEECGGWSLVNIIKPCDVFCLLNTFRNAFEMMELIILICNLCSAKWGWSTQNRTSQHNWGLCLPCSNLSTCLASLVRCLPNFIFPFVLLIDQEGPTTTDHPGDDIHMMVLVIWWW